MSVLPIVSPANNAEGIALMPVITALYPFALEEGTVNPINCFLIKKESELDSSRTVPTPIKTNLKRIILDGESEFTGKDYGDTVDAGRLYRSLIEIEPIAPLDPYTEYSVILSKEIAKKSVFDVSSNIANTGTIAPLAQGPYEGFLDRILEIEITIGGSESTAKYVINELPFGDTSEEMIAAQRFIEFEDGLFIKFPRGTYVAGDKFTVECKPSIKIGEIYSWDFKTGSDSTIVPNDENSDVVVGLPVEDSNGTSTPPEGAFQLLSVEPELNSVMNSKDNRSVTFTFSKTLKPDSITAGKIKILAESTIGADYGPLVFTHTINDNKLIINFTEEVVEG